MNSEHRHELQTNSLAALLTNLPELLKKHSSRIMTVLAIILLAFAVWNYRHNQYLAKEAMVASALNNAWNNFDHLQRLSPVMDSEMRRKTLEEYESDINTSLQAVIENADAKADRAKLASAFQLKGDLYWTLASDLGSAMPSTQPSTTQPTSRPVSEYLSKSEASYNKVLSDYADIKGPATVARFGLAAIAENRRDWTTARKIYGQIIDEYFDKSPDAKTQKYEYFLARARNDKVEDLQNPLLKLEPRIVLENKKVIGNDLITPQEKPVDSTIPGLNLLPNLGPANPQ